jgi:uncharacterized repeat protein (TIGR03803 family)
LAADATGTLYSTASDLADPKGAGNVFKLTPAGSVYKESVLWSFNVTDGYVPSSSLVEDKNGDLYGTTRNGGSFHSRSEGCGTVFELKRHAKKYTEQLLWP